MQETTVRLPIKATIRFPNNISVEDAIDHFAYNCDYNLELPPGSPVEIVETEWDEDDT